MIGQDLVKQLIKQFGVFEYHESITEKTTHLVAGAAKRTVNLLKVNTRF